jgi:hypothetical protein
VQPTGLGPSVIVETVEYRPRPRLGNSKDAMLVARITVEYSDAAEAVLLANRDVCADALGTMLGEYLVDYSAAHNSTVVEVPGEVAIKKANSRGPSRRASWPLLKSSRGRPMCPDNDTPAPAEQNPTLAEDDKFRRTIVPAEGPNKDGYDTMVKAAHTRPDADRPDADEPEEPSASMEPATTKHTPVRDIEPSMPAPDAPHMPDVPLEG